MVSPQPAAPSNPPLSYADRAKKAQNTRPQHPPSAQRVGSQGASTFASTTAASTSGAASGSSATSSVAKSSPAISAEPTPASSTQAASRPASPPHSDSNLNGDVKKASADSQLPDSVPQTESESTPKAAPAPAPAPAVNVWSLRKEQMAKTRSNQAASTSTSIQEASPNSGSGQSESLLLRSGETSIATASGPSALQNVTNKRTSPPMATGSVVPNGGVSEHVSGEDKAFIVRPRAPLALDDAESWPEVGKSASKADSKDKEDGEQATKAHEREKSTEGSQSHGPSRKSEKTKWVPMPLAELQAAADAARPQHARNRSHHSHHPHNTSRYTHPGSSSVSASGSGSASQNQSRTQSVVDMRQSVSNSHASSVSHSQVQSRTGSAHSSPRGAFARGGRRLPAEEGTVINSSVPVASGAASRSISMRSSAAGSPQTFQSTLHPPEFIPNHAMGYRPMPPNLAARGSGSAEQVQDAPTINGAIPPYYPPLPVPPPLGTRRSYHSPHSSGSPVHNPYPLQPAAPIPTMYPSHPGPPNTAHPGYAGSPPYPYYPAYNYAYTPYMYWPPPPISHSPVAPEGAPPATVLARPPPLGKSEAVAGYPDAGFVLPPPATYGPPLETQGRVDVNEQKEGNVGGVQRGRRARELSFGSIEAVVQDGSSQPVVVSSSEDALGLDVSGVLVGESAQEGEDVEKPMPPFTIGVAPGETGPTRIRSSTRTQSKGRTLVLSEGAIVVVRTTSEQSEAVTQASEGDVGALVVDGEKEGETVIDLTDSGETKWEFGTTRHTEENEDGQGADLAASSAIPTGTASAQEVESYMSPPTNEMPISEPLIRPPPIPPIMTTTNGLSSASSPSYDPPSASEPGSADEWKVKDYGYGFGRKNDFASSTHGDERNRRDWQQDREYYGRPRRGSFGGGYNYERGGFERGGYSGRRGRGMGGGFGGRGAYHARTHSRGGGTYQAAQARQPPPFVVQPPPAPLQTDLNGYYMPPPPPLSTYFTPAYEAYPSAFPPYVPPTHNASAPVPFPLSPISFPLDPTRYYLLGQLEYYLSPQNMAQDFFLRQRMDSKGWISIELIASFKRVRQLTDDVQLVKDVLGLSTLVEVKNEWVRSLQWEKYKLPDAAPSAVDVEQDANTAPPSEPPTVGHVPAEEVVEGEEGEEEEEEEDVVFVLGKEADPSWTSERHLG